MKRRMVGGRVKTRAPKHMQTHKQTKPNVLYLLNISLHKFIMSGRFLSKHRDEKSTP